MKPIALDLCYCLCAFGFPLKRCYYSGTLYVQLSTTCEHPTCKDAKHAISDLRVRRNLFLSPACCVADVINKIISARLGTTTSILLMIDARRNVVCTVPILTNQIGRALAMHFSATNLDDCGKWLQFGVSFCNQCEASEPSLECSIPVKVPGAEAHLHQSRECICWSSKPVQHPPSPRLQQHHRL